MSGFDAVDLFAGPGGWDTAAAILGVRTVGVETNPLACATARAAGHVRVQRSVAELDPARFRRVGRGLIGSPPCPPFSKAGKRLGMKDQPRLFAHVDAVEAAGEWVDYGSDAWHDEDSPMTLEPLRWAMILRPVWIALEQVPDVLPFWERLAVLLRSLGYTAWCGVLDSEMYGVPQTRDRAILIASRNPAHNVSRPPATHHRFRPGQLPTVDLFDDLLPWVSMADALGWNGAAYHLARGTGMNARHGERPDTPMTRPAPVITSKARTASWVFTNNDSRTAGGGKERFRRSTDAPSPTISGQVRSWSVRFDNQENSAVRSVDEPAATIRYGERMNACDWIVSYRSNRATGKGGNVPRPADEPAPTVDCQGQATWVHDAPATTVQGDPRIAPRGHHDRQFNGETVRVSVEEAACLQSFPPGYPWQGSRTARYQQIGNAVPVLLGVAVLGHLLGINGWRDVCREAYAQSERVA